MSACEGALGSTMGLLDCSPSPPVTITAASPTGSSSVSCPKFDASLGALTTIVFLPNAGYVGTGFVTLKNNNSTAWPVTAHFGMRFQYGPIPGGSSTQFLVMSMAPPPRTQSHHFPFCNRQGFSPPLPG